MKKERMNKCRRARETMKALEKETESESEPISSRCLMTVVKMALDGVLLNKY